MEIRIEKNNKERIVVIGGGFGGLQLCQDLAKTNYQVVLIDRNNFHQFQPLYYQVATCGLESSSIVFPFRKIFQKAPNVHFRLTTVEKINPQENTIQTLLGEIQYDHLVIATGAGNNYFGNANIEKHALPMKSLTESLHLRNLILKRFEEALYAAPEDQEAYLTFVIAGGGPTGTELAGALAEFKYHVMPRDYKELDHKKMHIIMVEGGPRVLGAMHPESSEKAHHYLKELGVEVRLATLVQDYDGEKVTLKDAGDINTKTLIWSAGIKGNVIPGLDAAEILPGNRFAVDEFNKVKGYDNVYAIGDIGALITPEYPRGHPQMAQPAIQQGKNVAKNFIAKSKGGQMKAFAYKNLGSMATIGKNKAVVELPKLRFGGFIAWLAWMFVHLRSIFGIKNKFFIFINWVYNYFTFNSSLRLIIKRPDAPRTEETK